MITLTDSFKFADVIIVVLGIATYVAGYQVGRRLPLANLVVMAIATTVGAAISQSARDHTDSWHEVFLVGAIVMLITATVGAAVGHRAARSRHAPN